MARVPANLGRQTVYLPQTPLRDWLIGRWAARLFIESTCIRRVSGDSSPAAHRWHGGCFSAPSAKPASDGGHRRITRAAGGQSEKSGIVQPSCLLGVDLLERLGVDLHLCGDLSNL